MLENSLAENTFVQIAMVIGLVICVALFIKHAFLIAIGDKRSATLLHLMIEVYAIGLLCKILVIGPAVLRWHFADIGFPVACGYMVSEIGIFLRRRRAAEMSDRECVDYVLFMRQFMIVWFGVLSIGYEFFTGFMYAQTGLDVALTGTTDPVDILMYVIGVAIAIWFIRREKRIIREHWLAEDEAATRRAEEEKRARRRERKQMQQRRRVGTTKKARK